MKHYIVLFKDGTMLPFNSKPGRENFQSGSRLFEISMPSKDRYFDIDLLCSWVGNNYQENSCIKEIKKW